MYWESMAFALSQLMGDKFRTFLSLLGVSIGIFSIVAIFTAIDALQENVRRGFDTMSSNVVMVGQWPMMGEDEEGNADMTGEFRWWDYMRRPKTSYEDYRFLKANSTLGEDFSFSMYTSATVRYGRKSIKNTSVECITYDYRNILSMEMAQGRYFTPHEQQSGIAVAVIGNSLAQELFGNEDPVGKKIKVGPTTASVVGVIKKLGESIVSIGDMDHTIYLPFAFGKYMVNPRWAGNSIYVRAKDGVQQQELMDELRVHMRAHRRLAPGQKNNFSINTMTFLVESVQQVFSMISAVGWVIAGFSLLIGGFGIANIMFVSVKERTNIIGIQKALGAKKHVILVQFLIESVVLAVAGGLTGIFLVFLLVWLIPQQEGFVFVVSASNVVRGVLVASVIGILSGIMPAWQGANLNPVDAINCK